MLILGSAPLARGARIETLKNATEGMAAFVAPPLRGGRGLKLKAQVSATITPV